MADRSAKSDPYYEWLGIPPGNRPPTHYQMLGLVESESNVSVIATAAMRNSAFVRNFQTGAQSEFATRILTEIAEARAILSDPVKKKIYDASLGIGRPKPKPIEPPVRRVQPIAEEVVEVAYVRTNERREDRRDPVRSTSRKAKKSDNTAYWIVGSAAAGVVIAASLFFLRSPTRQEKANRVAVKNQDGVQPQLPPAVEAPNASTPPRMPREDLVNPKGFGDGRDFRPNTDPGKLNPSPWPPNRDSVPRGDGNRPIPPNGGPDSNRGDGGINRSPKVGIPQNNGNTQRPDTKPKRNSKDGLYDTVDTASWTHREPHMAPNRFREIGPEQSFVVGFRVWEGKSFGGNVSAIQAIYQQGNKKSYGSVFGREQGSFIEVVAKPGYAVGGIDCRTGAIVDGLKVIFRKIDGGKMDPNQSYTSPQYGKDTGGWQLTMTSNTMIRGILGDARDELNSLGFVMQGTSMPGKKEDDSE